MFNSDLKKEWLGQLEVAQEDYKDTFAVAQGYITSLFETRTQAVLVINNVETFINSIAQSPKQLEKEIGNINAELQFFKEVINIQLESDKKIDTSSSMAGIGAAGLGVAAFGPTAAMAIATTFGTASTGTAISSLGGAAAFNAAAAWLGGGALAAGGGGMAGGGALLSALGGPVTWTIGGVALAGSLFFKASKNKRIAEDAEQMVYQIKGQTNNLKKIQAEVIGLEKLTLEHSLSVNNELDSVIKLITGKKTPLLIRHNESLVSRFFRVKPSLFISIVLIILVSIIDKSGLGEPMPTIVSFIAIFAITIQLPVGIFRWLKTKFKPVPIEQNKLVALNASTIKKVNFDKLSKKKQDMLFTLVNNTLSLSKLISKQVG